MSAIETNVINIAVERDFYGLEGDGTVDLLQTAKESGEFAPLISRIRRERSIPVGAEHILAELVVNLTVRTQHIREAFLSTTKALANRLRCRTRDPEFLCKLVNDLLLQRVLQPIADRFGGGSFEAIPADIRESIRSGFVKPLMDASSRWRPAVPYLQSVSESIWDEMEAAITSEAVKKAHVTSLRTSVSPCQRVAYLSQLTWSVASLDAGSLIFGDVGPLAYVAGNHTYESLVEVDPTRAPVVTLPLSDRCLLVGASGAYPARLNTGELNAAAAELSLNFFVASKNTHSEQSLGHRIGTRLDSAWLHLMTGAESRFLELVDSVLQARSESGDSKSS